jgi:hypothetical protein
LENVELVLLPRITKSHTLSPREGHGIGKDVKIFQIFPKLTILDTEEEGISLFDDTWIDLVNYKNKYYLLLPISSMIANKYHFKFIKSILSHLRELQLEEINLNQLGWLSIHFWQI